MSFDQVSSLVLVFISPYLFALIGTLRWYYSSRLPGKIINPEPFFRDQVKSEIKKSYSIFIHGFLVWLVFKNQWMVFDFEGGYSQWSTAIFGMLWLEVWFYISHRLFHTKPLWFMHSVHHRSRRNTPWTGMSFSIIEKFIFSFGFLLGFGFFSLWMPIHFETLCFVYVVYFGINALGHSNFENFGQKFSKSFLGRILASATYHALHHQKSNCNYGLMTRMLDKLFKSDRLGDT